MSRAGVLRISALAALVAVIAALIAFSTRGASPDTTAAHRTPATSSARASSPPSTPAVTGNPNGTAPAPAAAPPASSRPVRVQIPAIAVDSALQPLGLTSDGSLQSPDQWQRAGWYSGGTQPGDVGPAIIAGHIDSTLGPAVFYRLHQLRPGDRVVITRADGHRLTFVVDDTQQYPKDHFPTEAVYGPTSLPLLRLVTCTGDFDARTHNYLDNLVVTSHLVST